MSKKPQMWMKSRYMSMLSNHLGIGDPPRNIKERNKSVRHFTLVFVPGALVFASLDIYMHRYLIATLLLFFAATLTICWRIFDGKRVGMLELLIMVGCTFIATGLIYDGGMVGFGIQWLLLYPFLAFFMRGQWHGWQWIGILILITAVLMLLQSLGRIELAYDDHDLFYFFGTFFFFTLLASGLNLLRQRYERLLEIEVDAQSRTALSYHDKLEYLAMYDPLTDLPNRRLARERVAEAIEHAQRESNTFAVAILDIERFHELDVLLGHDQAEAVLKMVAKRLVAMFRGVDTVARLESDEFLLVWPDLVESSINVVVNKILVAMEEPFRVNGTHISLSVCIGAAFYPQHGNSVAILLQHANMIHRRAKEEHFPFALYHSEWHSEELRRIRLLGKMRSAIAHEEMTLVYQPQVIMADGKILGVEALLRWHDPEEGQISPGEFIPLAEQSRLIDDLTIMVLKMAASQNGKWRDKGLDIRIAVNLSARHLIDLDLPDKISDCLLRYNGQPQHFKLEITETDVMAHPELALSVMRKIDAMGFQLSIDDFGTGYSSFAYLRELPVDELKIDQTFIRHFAERESDRKIVASMVSLAHGLDLRVVAEGIEDIETWEMLQKIGVDKAQGFLICRPVPPDELVAWLNECEGVYRP